MSGRAPMRAAVVIPTWNHAAAAQRCLAAVGRLTPPPTVTVVVENGSTPGERDALLAAVPADGDVRVVVLDVNRGFAGAVNAGLDVAFATGADAALVLNDDAEPHPDVLGALLAAAADDPRVGIVAPVVVDSDSGREVSRGERVSVPLLWAPRTLLRVRRATAAPYAVSGVLGAAFLITRACWQRVGRFGEEFFAYYEEVDYWLRVRRAGLAIVVAPAVCVAHPGFRGFGGGFTPVAAYLKARNLPLLVRRHGGVLDWIVFVPAYAAMVAASAVVHAGVAARVLPAMARGVADGLRGRTGAPPPSVLAHGRS